MIHFSNVQVILNTQTQHTAVIETIVF